MSKWTPVLEIDDWVISYYYEEYSVYHRCPDAVYSWDKLSQTRSIAFLDVYNRCIACSTKAPDEMLGMLRLIRWEK